ncbi:phosphotransferase [Fonsecaea pedrosoi]|nr:phosphotransferase [Fonsecaea pedrosoi]
MVTSTLSDLLTGSAGTTSDNANGEANGSLGQEEYCDLHGVVIKPLQQIEELTPLWLSMFLNRKIDENGFVVKPTGTGQMSNTYRVQFHDLDHPGKVSQVVVKFARNDKDTRDLGIRFGHYQREAVFYRRFGDRLSAGLPHCYGAVVDRHAWFTLVLEDLGLYDGYQGAQLEGCDYKHAQLALKALAQLQAPILGDAQLDEDEWLNKPPALDQKFFNECLPIFRTRQKLPPEQEQLLNWLSENLDDWWATREGPFCIFHGDFRLDNILFLAKDNHRAVAVDWGGLGWASPMRDAGYFLGNGLTIENRRKWEKDLIREYLDELNRWSKVQLTWEQAWKQYRLQSIYGLAQHIPAAAICAPTERGEKMFYTLTSRQAQHALDMDAASLVKPRPKSYSPHVGDEAEHVPPADGGPLWSESWYFDCTTPDGEAGMYARIGRLPNQNCCNFIAGIFRRGKSSVMLVNMQAPLPASHHAMQTFSTDRFAVESRCLVPLEKFSFSLSGTGSASPDSITSFHGDEAQVEDVQNIKIDLVWETSAAPYKKHGQSRYEIPCKVTGNIKIGDEEEIRFNAAPGQRNHSWGVRNWWVADWVWSGLHFSDGTDVFTIALGKGPDSTGASGYIQKDGGIREITKVVNEFEWQDNGLPGKLRLLVEPGGMSIECEAIAAGGLRLFDPDGREAHLPRVMCTATTSDGKSGVGWLDFNRVVKREPGQVRNGQAKDA